MKVFVFEHVCGGAAPLGDVPAGIVRQGCAMLEAVVGDLVNAGHEVASVLHADIEDGMTGAHVVRVGTPVQAAAAIDRRLSEAEAALVIAPESDGALEHWCGVVERSGKRSLSCSVTAARLCGDKLALSEHLRGAGVATPGTSEAARRRGGGGPFIVKPRHGAGGEHTRLFLDIRSQEQACGNDDMIVQPWHDGRHVSASFIVCGDRARSLRAGDQFIHVCGDSGVLSYRGGRLPLEEPYASRAVTLAEAALRRIDGLNGFVGVDLVLADDPGHDVIIEVNPRLTMSYVGLRALCASNLASAMLDPGAPIDWRDGSVEFDATGRLCAERRP